MIGLQDYSVRESKAWPQGTIEKQLPRGPGFPNERPFYLQRMQKNNETQKTLSNGLFTTEHTEAAQLFLLATKERKGCRDGAGGSSSGL